MQESQLIDRHLIELTTLAGEYCLAVENADQTSKADLLSFLGKISPLLYMQGNLFPETEEPEQGFDERMVTEEQWENAFNSIRNILGKEDTFSQIDYTLSETDEVIPGSLAEFYADVYQDLKDFLWLMTKNTFGAKKYAAYSIKQLFISNWGFKLLQAQLILHSRMLKSSTTDDYSDLF